MGQRLLHVGCGPKSRAQTTPEFAHGDWDEIRLDIDPTHAPDIHADITAMTPVADASVDAVFSAHNLEHLEAYQVPAAVAEFARVLAPGGYAVITCPDLQAVCGFVARGLLTQPLYASPAGQIAALDAIFGHRASITAGNGHMAHRCGFTETLLAATLRRAGFITVVTARREQHLDLWGIAAHAAWDAARIVRTCRMHFPPGIEKLAVCGGDITEVPAIWDN